MADTDNLGEYKVVVSADYRKLAKDIENINKMFSNLADTIKTDLGNAISGSISQFTGAMELSIRTVQDFNTQMKQATTYANSFKGGMDIAGNATNGLGNKAGKASKDIDRLTESEKKARTEAEILAEAERQADAMEAQHAKTSQQAAGSLNAKGEAAQKAAEKLRFYEQAERKAYAAAQQAHMNNSADYPALAEKYAEAHRTLMRFREGLRTLPGSYESVKQAEKATIADANRTISNMVKERFADEKARQADSARTTKLLVQERFQTIRELQAAQDRYNAAVNRANSYLETGTRMSARTFRNLQQEINGAENALRRMGSAPTVANPLANFHGYDNYLRQTGLAIQQTTALGDAMKSLRHHITWMVSAIAMTAAFTFPAKMIDTIRDVELGMAGFRQVNHEADQSQQVLNEDTQKFVNIAQQYGTTVDEVIESTKLWGRGYKDLSDVVKLTSLSMKLAVADAFSPDLANRAVESMVNQFQQQARAVDFATHAVDSWTKVAHNSQAAAKDIADAMMRSGAAAHAVGVDFDTATALAATMIKTTGLAGATVGESMKSLFSSIHSKKGIQAIQDLGIEIYKFDTDGTRHFRNVKDVMLDLMTTSHTTSRNMEKDLLAISGGKFQWSKVASVLGDYKDFIHNYNLSIQSAGFADQQVGAQLDTIDRRMKQLKADITGMFSGIGASGLTTAIKGWIQDIDNFVRVVRALPASFWQSIGTMVKLAAEIGALLGVAKLGRMVFASLTTSINMFGVATARTAIQEGVANAATAAHNISLAMSNIAHQQAMATLTLETGAKAASIIVTNGLTIATTALSTAVTVLTAGLNIVLAVIAAVALGETAYEMATVDATAAIDKESDALQKNQEIKQSEMEMSQKQTEFIETLANQHIKLKRAIDSGTLSEERAKQVKDDLAATDQELAQIIGEDGVERINSSADVQKAIKMEQHKHTEKTLSIEAEILDIKQAEIDHTDSMIQQTQDRIDALKSEAEGWSMWAKVAKGAMGIMASISSMRASYERAVGNTGMADALDAAAEKQRNYMPDSVEQSLENEKSKLDELTIKRRKQQVEYDRAQSTYQMHKTAYDLGENPYAGIVEATDLPEGASPADSTNKGKTGEGASGHTSRSTPPDNSPERKTYDALVKGGLSPAMAEGLMGNLSLESGFNPLAGWGTSHQGIVQWDRDRFENLRAYAQQVGAPVEELSTQVGFILYELQHGEGETYKKILNSGATTPEQFAVLFDLLYERSGNTAGDENNWERQKAARSYTRFEEQGKKQNLIDPTKSKKQDYGTLKKLYQDRLANMEYDAELKGKKVTDTQKWELWRSMTGINGENVQLEGETVKQGSSLSAMLLNQAKYMQNAQGGTQWMDAVQGNTDAQNQCASYVSALLRAVEGKGSAVDSALTWGGAGAMREKAQALGAWKDVHDASQIKAGNIIIFGNVARDTGHAAVAGDNGDYYARNSSSGIAHGAIAKMAESRGGILGVIDVDLLPEAKEFSKTIHSSWSVLADFNKDTREMQMKAIKEQLELYRKKIELIRTATDNAIAATDKMADEENKFGKKLGLISERDIAGFNEKRTDTEYSRVNAFNTNQLGKTARADENGKARAQEMLLAYQNFFDAEDNESRKFWLQEMIRLSDNVDATKKALDEKFKADVEYYSKKAEYARQSYSYETRYGQTMIDSFSKSFGDAINDTLTKAQNWRDSVVSIIKSVYSSVVRLFADDMATKIKQVLSRAYNQPTATGHRNGSARAYDGFMQSVFPAYPLQSLADSRRKKPVVGEFNVPRNDMLTAYGTGNNPSAIFKDVANTNYAEKFGASWRKVLTKVNASAKTVGKTMQGLSKGVVPSIQAANTQVIASDTAKNTAIKTNAITTAQTVSMAKNGETQAVIAGDQAQVASGNVKQASLLANLGAMMTQMLAMLAIAAVFGALFGGGGSKTSRSESSVNLGRSPDTYYMTPTAVMQSTTIPSMDIGGNIEKDMLIYAHQNEMVLTADQAGVIRGLADHGGANGGSARVKSSINVNTVDSKGFDRVLRNYNRNLSRQVKKGIRNGYLNANGLV